MYSRNKYVFVGIYNVLIGFLIGFDVLQRSNENKQKKNDKIVNEPASRTEENTLRKREEQNKSKFIEEKAI